MLKQYKTYCILLLLLLLKEFGSARLREGDIHSISPKTPAPRYQPIDRKKRKGRREREEEKGKNRKGRREREEEKGKKRKGRREREEEKGKKRKGREMQEDKGKKSRTL